MSRPLRIEYPGALYHVTARGNARESIFRNDVDRKTFLVVLGKIVERYNWLCHAYCLMGNHYHLMIETPDGNLSQGMRQLNGVYTQTFNRRHRRVGHLLQGRFKAILVEKDSYLQELCRYIVLNPVRAKMVKHPKLYAWSSDRALAGLVKPPDFLTREWLLSQFGRERRTAETRYRAFVAQGTGQPSPWDKLTGQVLLGSETFVKRAARQLKAAETLSEIPRRQRLAARPGLNTLLPKQGFKDKPIRDKAIHQAHRDHGYTLVEIGRALDLHYTTISKVVNRDEA
jgi:REP element-mobilizing transposase RayT